MGCKCVVLIFFDNFDNVRSGKLKLVTENALIELQCFLNFWILKFFPVVNFNKVIIDLVLFEFSLVNIKEWLERGSFFVGDNELCV